MANDIDTEPAPSRPPLHGIRVLDLSRVLAGPWCTQILGDLGAQVIKVEQPGGGDDTRKWGPPFLEDRDGADAAYYTCANRNKSAIAVDFARPEGATLVREIAAECDILVENFKVGSLAKYGLDYHSIRPINPRLVYCSITGFGQTGPYAGRGGYDFLIQALSGLMSVTGPSDGTPGAGPTKVGIPISDLITGVYASVSVLAALRHSEATGEGQHVDISLLDSQLAVMANQGSNFLVGGHVPTRLGNAHPNVVPYRDFNTADSSVVVAVGNDGQFRALCHMLGLAGLADDDRFANNSRRLRHRAELEARLQAEIGKWTTADFLAGMEKHAVPGGPINSLEDILRDPQVRSRKLVQSLKRDDGVEIPFIAYPAKFSRSPVEYHSAPPPYARDTTRILSDVLQLSGERLAELRAQGVIAG